MTITILDDYQNIIRKLECFATLKNQNVQIINSTEKDIKIVAKKNLNPLTLIFNVPE